MRQLPNLAGLQVLDSLVRIVENKSEIKKVIAEIREAHDEANAKIVAAGKIRDIDLALSEASRDRAEAARELGRAKQEAAALRGEAGEAARAEKERQRRADEILAGQQKASRQLAAREKRIAARESELQAQMDAAKAEHAEAMELKARADEVLAESEEKLKVFRRAAAQLQ